LFLLGFEYLRTENVVLVSDVHFLSLFFASFFFICHWEEKKKEEELQHIKTPSNKPGVD